MSYLLIVESFGKIKKIQQILGQDYKIMASCGHIRDLDKTILSIEIQNNFNPIYVINNDKLHIINEMKQNLDKQVLIATDGDREGEGIAFHIQQILQLKQYQRIIFYSITKNEILKSLQQPKQINMNLFYAYQTRRILDRLVGYKLSPLLKNIQQDNKKYLGTGRVQSVVVKLIVEKEELINKQLQQLEFKYKLNGTFLINNQKLQCNIWFKRLQNNKLIDNDINKLDILSIFNLIQQDNKFIIQDVQKNIIYQKPQEPFITSTIQQFCILNYKLQVQQIMQYLQQLYEMGLITYMRTDNTMISQECLQQIQQFILNKYSQKYYHCNQYKSKNQYSQEAHECIRPCDIFITDLQQYNLQNTIQEKIYISIWQRTIASQMSNAQFQQIQIKLQNKFYIIFQGCIKNLLFDGYLVIYGNNDEQFIFYDDLKLNKIQFQQCIGQQQNNQISNRYNLATLIKKLEKLNIGRPATYQSILQKILNYDYIKQCNVQGQITQIQQFILNKQLKIINKKIQQKIGFQKNVLQPTQLGIQLTHFLNQNFQNIVDYQFTSNIENQLDQIANGQLIWYDVLKQFYEQFKLQLLQLNIIDEIIIGQYNKQDIIYYISQYGPTIKVKLNKQYIYVNIKQQPNLQQAIQLIQNKLNKINK